MGVHAVMLIGYEKGESVATNMCVKSSLCHTICLFKFFVLSLEAEPPNCQSKPFSKHSNEAKTWAAGGADLIATYLTHHGALHFVQIFLC